MEYRFCTAVTGQTPWARRSVLSSASEIPQFHYNNRSKKAEVSISLGVNTCGFILIHPEIINFCSPFLYQSRHFSSPVSFPVNREFWSRLMLLQYRMNND